MVFFFLFKKSNLILRFICKTNTHLFLLAQDDVLAKLFQGLGKTWVSKYHLFDSLLEPRPDEQLTPEEEEQAVRDYLTLEAMQNSSLF